MFKNTQQYKKTKGFTLIELMVVIAIIGAAVALLAPTLLDANIESNEGELVTDISLIQKGASKWASGDLDFAGLTIQALSQDKYIPTRFSDGVGTNPFKGNWSIGAGADGRSYTITATGLPVEVCRRLARSLDSTTCDGVSSITQTVG